MLHGDQKKAQMEVVGRILRELDQFEPVTDGLVGVNDYSMGHECGQQEAVALMAAHVRDLFGVQGKGYENADD